MIYELRVHEPVIGQLPKLMAWLKDDVVPMCGAGITLPGPRFPCTR